jgi:hypothetical protein
LGTNRYEPRSRDLGQTNILHGTLALMVLRTLDVLGPKHGYGIGRRIEQAGPCR